MAARAASHRRRRSRIVARSRAARAAAPARPLPPRRMTTPRTVIVAEQYDTIAVATQAAIDLSKREGRMVTVSCETDAIRRAVGRDLEVECDGSEDQTDFWGRDVDGKKWRVRIR